MQMMRSSMSAASGSQLNRELSRVQAQTPCWSPSRSMHSRRKPKSALMSAACAYCQVQISQTASWVKGHWCFCMLAPFPLKAGLALVLPGWRHSC